MTEPQPAGPLPRLDRDHLKARLRAAQTGQPPPADPRPVPDSVRAAIHAGHITQVVVFCDTCGVEHRGDYIGADRPTRLAAARAHLATQRWTFMPGYDGCPQHPDPEDNSWDDPGDNQP
jgi:hypothetical protein